MSDKGYTAHEMPESAKQASLLADKAIKKAQEKDFAEYDANTGKLKINFNKFSSYFLEQYNLVWVDDGKYSSLMKYNAEHGYWAEINKGILTNLIADVLGELWSHSARRDAIDKVTDDIKRIGHYDFINSKTDAVYNFKNGVFNWGTMQIEPHNEKYNFTSVAGIELDTNSNTSTVLTNEWFKETFGDDTKTIKEYIGYMFFPSYKPIQAFVILLGNGNNGKSTFLDYLANILGKGNVTFVPLQDITGKNATRFKISVLANKYANFNADISDQYIEKPDVLKNLTGGDRINADVKGKDDIQFTNYAKMLFSTNSLPTVRDNTKGFFRRTNILQFKEIPSFDKKYNWGTILAERPAFIWECIQLANEAMKRHQLFKSKHNELLTKDWLYSNDPIKEFLADCTIKRDGEQTLRDKLYNAYCWWCDLNGYSYVNSRKFYKALRDKEGIKQKDKKEPYKKREYYFTDIVLSSRIETKHPKDRVK